MRIAASLLLGAILGIFVTVNESWSMDMSITNLRCENRVDPLGIDRNPPDLSWNLQSSQRDQKQTAYQILVATSEDLLKQDQGDLWDSGKVAPTNQTISVPYQGKSLESEVKCFWKVRIWDQDDQVSAWSAPASWTMDLLNSTDWKAQWIGWDKSEPVKSEIPQDISKAQWIWYPMETPATNAPPETVYFRRVFSLPLNQTLSKAILFLTADNRFNLWVNGENIGRGENFKQFFSFDVASHLHAGQNVIAISVANLGEGPNPAGLIGDLKLEYENGSSDSLRTDEEWRTSRTAADNWFAPDLNDSAWKAAKPLGQNGVSPWGEIKATESEAQQRRLPARYLRKEFSLEKPIRRAMAYVSGLGLFELHLNGKKVGDHVLEPALTEYSKRVFYVTFDVKDLLTNGKNALGVILGNGRYYAPRLSVPTETKTTGYPKLFLQLSIEFEDGSRQTVVSDPDWKITTNGPIRANNEYDGEEYDAQMEIPGWDQTGFNDSAWEPVQAVEPPQGVVCSQNMEPIRITETLNPVSMNSPKPGMYIFDMGQNMVGWCKLTVAGPKGTQVKLRHAEVLKNDGTLYLDNIRSAEVTDIYTLKGDGTEIYEPRFTYHGFRYVEMTGFPGTPTLSTIQGQVVHDDVEQVGTFTCSNSLLDQIHKNIFWGVRGNYRSLPTDCPQRDERQGWLGDRAGEARGETYLFNIIQLYRKWMMDIDDAQKDTGSVPSVAPTYWPMNPDDVTWPSCFIIIPGTLYDQYGDFHVLDERYEGMKAWIQYMSGFLQDNIMPRDTYGDWCVPPESPELIHSQDPRRQTAKALLGTSYFYFDLRLMARYAHILGHEEDSRQFASQAEAIKSAFIQKFFNPDENQFDNGSQTSYVLPLAFGLVPEDHHQAVFERLVHKIVNETNSHIGTGLIGGQWLMRVLSNNGRPDLAYTIASQKDYPSWGYMISKGATTIWELWNGDTADPAMNSGNHVMLVGDLNTWFMEYLGGIQADPENPGFQHILMHPNVVGDLTFCNASYQSIRGLIKSNWKVEDGDRFIWNVTIPANTTATLSIPAKEPESIRESGVPLSLAKGVKVQAMEKDYAILRISSGNYQFVSQNFR